MPKPGTRRQFEPTYAFGPGTVVLSRPFPRLDLVPQTTPFIIQLKGVGVFGCHTHGKMVATFRGNPAKYCADCGGVMLEAAT
jgi:hypothetical protein